MDFTGDGFIDLAYGIGSHFTPLLVNDGKSALLPTPTPLFVGVNLGRQTGQIGYNDAEIRHEDVNEDGFVDLIAGFDSQSLVLVGNERGVLRLVADIRGEGQLVGSGDLNDDGHIDLLIGHADGGYCFGENLTDCEALTGKVLPFAGDGRGNFTALNEGTPLTDALPTSLAQIAQLADLTGNGKLDLLYATKRELCHVFDDSCRSRSTGFGVLLGDGTGRFLDHNLHFDYAAVSGPSSPLN